MLLDTVQEPPSYPAGIAGRKKKNPEALGAGTSGFFEEF